jgi:hypothetical protein
MFAFITPSITVFKGCFFGFMAAFPQAKAAVNPSDADL